MRRREFLRTAAVGAAGVSILAPPGGAAQDPYRPLGSVPIENAKEAVVGPDGRTAYVAATDGFATVDVSDPANPTVLAERRGLLKEHDGGPLQQIWDAKVDGDRLLVAGPANPVNSDVVQGFLLYDVSDPTTPKRVAFHETDFPIHNAVFVDGVAYLTGNDGDGNPLVMVDTSDDDPEEVGRWSMLDRDEAWSEVDSWVRTLHDVWVQDGVAYLAQWDAGTWLVDVSDPSNPQYLTHFGNQPRDELASIPDDGERDAVLGLPGNHHFSMPNGDASLVVVNKEAWAVGGEGGPGGVELWDLSDRENPEKLSEIPAPRSADPSYDRSRSPSLFDLGLADLSPVGLGAAHGTCHDCTGDAAASGQWTTSHNFDVRGDRLYTSWYQGGVKIHDIGDPSNPEELSWWRRPQETSFWTVQHVTDEFFVAGSMGRHDDDRGGFYTFPNRPGEQENPPALAPGNDGGGGISAPNGDTTEGGGQPGFGFGAAVLAGVTAGALARFRGGE